MAEISLTFSTEGVARKITNIAKDKLNKALKDPNVNFNIADVYKRILYKYVPYKTGTLRDSGEVVQHGYHASVEYEAINPKTDYDYAPIQYRMFSYHHLPGKYDHWNRHVSNADRESFYAECKRIISEAMQNA